MSTEGSESVHSPEPPETPLLEVEPPATLKDPSNGLSHISTSTIGPQRHTELWFADGSVICKAEQTLFKVHISLLCRHSEFFRDLFSLPQPEDPHLTQTTSDADIPVKNPAENVEKFMSYVSKYVSKHERSVEIIVYSPSIPSLRT